MLPTSGPIPRACGLGPGWQRGSPPSTQIVGPQGPLRAPVSQAVGPWRASVCTRTPLKLTARSADSRYRGGRAPRGQGPPTPVPKAPSTIILHMAVSVNGVSYCGCPFNKIPTFWGLDYIGPLFRNNHIIDPNVVIWQPL